jgi:hypothetical protein
LCKFAAEFEKLIAAENKKWGKVRAVGVSMALSSVGGLLTRRSALP